MISGIAAHIPIEPPPQDVAVGYSDWLAAGDGYPQRYWVCECCGSLIVTNKQDSVAGYQCPQCTISKCEHGGRYVELSLSAFASKANIVSAATALVTEEKKPKRRIALTLSLEADSRAAAIDAIDQIVRELRMGYLQSEACSGGYSSGYTLKIIEDETVTHDSYFAKLNAYIEQMDRVQSTSRYQPV